MRSPDGQNRVVDPDGFHVGLCRFYRRLITGFTYKVKARTWIRFFFSVRHGFGSFIVSDTDPLFPNSVGSGYFS